MPCGRPRATAQALQHIWISEETLTQAFDRFVRVSNAHRRHGSNVPGPLEAQRRLAKRRMGMGMGMGAVGAGAPPPSGFDLGALFGLGSARPPPDFEKEWRWQRPSRPPTSKDIILETREPRPALVLDQDILKPLAFVDPIDKSTAEFDAILKACPTTDPVPETAIRQLVNFLDSPKNEPGAHLTLRLVGWLKARSDWRKDSWEHVARSFHQRAEHSEITNEEAVAILDLLLATSAHGEDILPMFISLPASMSEVYAQVTDKLVECALGREEVISRVNSWLYQLQCAGPRSVSESGHLQKDPHNIWHDVYQRLARRFQPSDFPRHFGTYSNTTLLWVLYQYWAPRRHTDSDYARLSTTPLQAVPSLTSTFSKLEQPDECPRYIFVRALKVFRRAFSKGRMQVLGYPAALVRIFQHLSPDAEACNNIIANLLSIWMAMRKTERILELVKDIGKLDDLEIRPGQATMLMRYMLSKDNPMYAFRAFSELPDLPLRDYSDLPLRLVQHGNATPEAVWRTLNRSTPNDRIARDERKGIGNFIRNDLPPEHVELAHKVGYAWACSSHIDARAAFRRVWEVYQFLRSRRAPISSLLARAMVRAGISRPIVENKRLAKAQVKYVISIVERIEGPDAAHKLDKMVYEWWTAVKAKYGYTPGTREPQERFWKHNRMIWRDNPADNRPRPAVSYRIDWSNDTHNYDPSNLAKTADYVPHQHAKRATAPVEPMPDPSAPFADELVIIDNHCQLAREDAEVERMSPPFEHDLTEVDEHTHKEDQHYLADAATDLRKNNRTSYLSNAACSLSSWAAAAWQPQMAPLSAKEQRPFDSDAAEVGFAEDERLVERPKASTVASNEDKAGLPKGYHAIKRIPVHGSVPTSPELYPVTPSPEEARRDHTPAEAANVNECAKPPEPRVVSKRVGTKSGLAHKRPSSLESDRPPHSVDNLANHECFNVTYSSSLKGRRAHRAESLMKVSSRVLARRTRVTRSSKPERPVLFNRDVNSIWRTHTVGGRRLK